MRSADGTRRWIARAQPTSRGWLAPNCVPSCIASATAADTARVVVAEDQRAVAAEVIDVAVAIDVPLVRAERARGRRCRTGRRSAHHA